MLQLLQDTDPSHDQEHAGQPPTPTRMKKKHQHHHHSSLARNRRPQAGLETPLLAVSSQPSRGCAPGARTREAIAPPPSRAREPQLSPPRDPGSSAQIRSRSHQLPKAQPSTSTPATAGGASRAPASAASPGRRSRPRPRSAAAEIPPRHTLRHRAGALRKLPPLTSRPCSSSPSAPRRAPPLQRHPLRRPLDKASSREEGPSGRATPARRHHRRSRRRRRPRNRGVEGCLGRLGFPPEPPARAAREGEGKSFSHHHP
uniref:Uncharacterized protein n=1 Tax=Aegilops tauschii subsp. strangulata TaxID=200361 RepID=A0A453FTM2_AEGTS